MDQKTNEREGKSATLKIKSEGIKNVLKARKKEPQEVNETIEKILKENHSLKAKLEKIKNSDIEYPKSDFNQKIGN